MPASVDKREARIRGMFAAIAPRYDLLNHLLSFNIDRSWRRRTTRLAPPRDSAPILDLCTGTGDLALAYDQAAGGSVSIIAADFCHPMLVSETPLAIGIAFSETKKRHYPSNEKARDRRPEGAKADSGLFVAGVVARGPRREVCES